MFPFVWREVSKYFVIKYIFSQFFGGIYFFKNMIDSKKRELVFTEKIYGENNTFVNHVSLDYI